MPDPRRRRPMKSRPRPVSSRSAAATAISSVRSPGCSSTSASCSWRWTRRIPLLERAKFLAIFSNNLDEFFMVRVAGLKRRIATGLAVRSAAGLEPRELLDRISTTAQDLMRLHSWVFWDQVRPALQDEGITHRALVASCPKPSGRPSTACSASRSSPCSPHWPSTRLTRSPTSRACRSTSPSSWSTPRPAPSTSPGLRCRRRCPGSSGCPNDGVAHRDDHDARFVPLEDVIAAHLDQLFTGMEVREHYTFRVTRNEDLEVEEDDAENLLTALEKELTRRRFGPPVRLEVDDADRLARARPAHPRARRDPRRDLQAPRPAGLARPLRPRRPRPVRPQGRAVGSR
jgi:polyphosphate kinase